MDSSLSARALRLIADSPLPDGMKARFLQDADAGEWDIAVEDVCCQIHEYDYFISHECYQVLAELHEELDLDRGDLELVAEHCVLPASASGTGTGSGTGSGTASTPSSAPSSASGAPAS